MMSRCMNQLAAALLCAGACCAVGCRGPSQRVQSLEAQLRQQDGRIIALSRSLEEANAELEASAYETRILRQSLSDLSVPPAPEEAETAIRIKDIEIVSLLSGGLDRDGVPGDELLTLLVSPRDGSGETLRTSGQLIIEAFDFAGSDEQQQRIGHWEFADAELSDLWHSGVIGRGFRLVDRWQTAPSGKAVTVHARLVTKDGRQFDRTAQLSVVPMFGLDNSIQQVRSGPGGLKGAHSSSIAIDEPEFESELDVREPVATTSRLDFDEWVRTRTLADN